MLQNRSKFTDALDSSLPNAGLENYIQKTTDELFSLLDEIERDIKNARRIHPHDVHGSIPYHYKDNKIIKETVHEPTFKTNGQPRFSAERLRVLKPKQSEVEGSYRVKYTEEHDTKIKLSVTGENTLGINHMGQDQICELRKNSRPNNWENSWSYVDFNLTRPEVKWHKGLRGIIPQNAHPIGYTKLGRPLYGGRTWDDKRSFLIPGLVNADEGECIYGREGKSQWSTDYEIMECKSVAWLDAKGTPVTELPALAYNAGYNEKDEPLYFGRAFIDGALIPGYIEKRYTEVAPNNRAFSLVIPFRGNELYMHGSYEVMIVIPNSINLAKESVVSF